MLASLQPENLPTNPDARYTLLEESARNVWEFVDRVERIQAEDLTQALRTIARVRPDPIHEACALWAEGYLIPDAVGALTAFEKAHALFATHGRERTAARLSILIAQKAGLLGQTIRALESLNFAEQYFQAEPDYGGWPALYINRSDVHRRIGDYKGMLSDAQAGEQYARRFNRPTDEIRALLNQSVAYLALGQLDRAEQILIEVQQRTPTLVLRGVMWLNFAHLYLAQSRLFDALKALSAARDALRQSGELVDKAIADLEESKILARLGMLPEAVVLAEEAANSNLAEGLLLESIESRLHAIHHWWELGHFQRAQKQLSVAQAQADKAPRTFQALLTGLSAHPAYQQTATEMQKALTTVVSQCEQLEALGARLEIYELRLLEAQLRLNLKDEQAQACLIALSTNTAVPDHIRLPALRLRAENLPWSEAWSVWQELLALWQTIQAKMPVDELKARLVQHQTEVYAHIIESLLVHGAEVQAQRILLQAKGTIWHELAHPSARVDYPLRWHQARDTLRDIELELRYARQDLQAASPNTPYSEQLGQNIALMEAKRESLEDELTALSRQTERTMMPNALPDWETIARQLPKTTAVVDYFIGQQNIYALIVHAQHPAQWVPLGHPADIQKPLNQLTNMIKGLQALTPEQRQTAATAQLPWVNKYLSQLGEQLWAPLQPHLERVDTLLISPMTWLYMVPWLALPLGDGHYLGEKYEVNILPSAVLLTHPKPPQATAVPRLLGYAGDPPLQFLHQEIQAIHEAVAEADQRLPATSPDLAFSRPPRYLHLAAHGTVNPQRPTHSGFQLADGAYRLLDMFNLSLQGTQVVTLSGCNTGLAPDRGGVPLAMGSVFLTAGAQTVLSSLWAVDDAGTQWLMRHFYKELTAGQTPAVALRRAQKQLRRQEHYQHPYFWGAFYPLIRHLPAVD